MKKIMLFSVIFVLIISCSKQNKIIEKSDIIGQWKEIQRKKTKKTSVYKVAKCEGEIYTFNSDNTYTVKGTCEDDNLKIKGTWIYRNNVLSLMRDHTNWKYSVSKADNDNLKFSIIEAEIEGYSAVDWFDMDAYMILEKQ